MATDFTPTQPALNKAADKAQDAVGSLKSDAHEVLDKASNKIDELKANAGPAIQMFSGHAKDLANQGLDKIRNLSQQAKDLASDGREYAESYVQDEPIKGMLIAAATGAALMGLIALLASSDD